jgi:hypothetical protein
MWSIAHKFAKDARELKSAHPHASRERSQSMFLHEPFHHPLSRRLNPFRIPSKLRAEKITRGGLRCIQIRRDNQIDHPLIRREVSTLLWQPAEPPSKKPEIVSYPEE